jgi:hypothetical protein
MNKLIAKLTLKDGSKNTKFLKVFTNEEAGTVSYSLVSDSGRHLQFQICNAVGEGLCFQITLMNTKTIGNCCPLL